MWSYNYTSQEELRHFGVLGMKWGIRRGIDSSSNYFGQRLHQKEVDKRESQFKKLSDERDQIRDTKGAASKSYIKKSKEMLEVEGKLKIANAKRDHDIGKRMVEEARELKDPLIAYTGANFKYRNKLYDDKKLTEKDKEAIDNLEYKMAKSHAIKEVLTPALFIAGGYAASGIISLCGSYMENKGSLPVTKCIGNKNAKFAKNIINSTLKDYRGLMVV